jgi:hypothetical protein
MPTTINTIVIVGDYSTCKTQKIKEKHSIRGFLGCYFGKQLVILAAEPGL